MSSREDSCFSGVTTLVSGSKSKDAPPPTVLEYEDYDIFQPCREIDAIIDDELYIGE
jgi:hypothetical protein